MGIVKWRGKSFVPPLCRIDIGFMPDKKSPGGVRVFVNEIEQECTTFLVRYCPFNLLDALGPIYVNKTRELLRGRLKSGEKVADRSRVEALLKVLDDRLDNCTKRKSSDEDGSRRKRARTSA